MSEHHASTQWKRQTTDFAYDSYSRDHRLTFGTGSSIGASAAPEFRGNAKLMNPEEALVGALSSCHMLTFLAICARKKLVVDSYDDDAVGHLEKNPEGRLAVTRVALHPRVAWNGTAPDEQTQRDLHHQAHLGCFIASSVKTAVTIELPATT